MIMLEKSNYVKGKYRKLIPRKQINEGWHYYKLHGKNTMIGIRVNLKEIYVVTEKGGEPMINPITKLPILEWNQQIESKILTKEHFEQIIESGFEDKE